MHGLKGGAVHFVASCYISHAVLTRWRVPYIRRSLSLSMNAPHTELRRQDYRVVGLQHVHQNCSCLALRLGHMEIPGTFQKRGKHPAWKEKLPIVGDTVHAMCSPQDVLIQIYSLAARSSFTLWQGLSEKFPAPGMRASPISLSNGRPSRAVACTLSRRCTKSTGTWCSLHPTKSTATARLCFAKSTGTATDSGRLRGIENLPGTRMWRRGTLSSSWKIRRRMPLGAN